MNAGSPLNQKRRQARILGISEVESCLQPGCRSGLGVLFEPLPELLAHLRVVHFISTPTNSRPRYKELDTRVDQPRRNVERYQERTSPLCCKASGMTAPHSCVSAPMGAGYVAHRCARTLHQRQRLWGYHGSRTSTACSIGFVYR